MILSNGDFEGDKTKTLLWSCSAVIFADLKSRLPNTAAGISVTAWDHIFSDHIFLDNIFSN
ncbi:hypothetical protein HID58_040767, partial [Brassica napus]